MPGWKIRGVHDFYARKREKERETVRSKVHACMTSSNEAARAMDKERARRFEWFEWER